MKMVPVVSVRTYLLFVISFLCLLLQWFMSFFTFYLTLTAAFLLLCDRPHYPQSFPRTSHHSINSPCIYSPLKPCYRFALSPSVSSPQHTLAHLALFIAVLCGSDTEAMWTMWVQRGGGLQSFKKKRKKKDKAISNLTEATNCVNVFGTSEKIILLSLIRQITSLNQPDQMSLTCAVLSLHS